jgi:uncharacterized protein (DUF1015 family)
VPYDVVQTSEAREFLQVDPLSFLQVTRAEATFAVSERPSTEEIFARAKLNLDRFIQNKIYHVDNEPAVYVYQIASPEHTQTGLVACCSLDEYENGAIKKHENVRPDKVEDRTEHLLALKAQTGLILLAFRGTSDTHSLFKEAIAGEPLYSFTSPDGFDERVWRLTDTAQWIEAFQKAGSLYVADGHHRIESAWLARERLRAANQHHTGDEDYNFVVAGMFPAEDLRILSYNRVVRELNGLSTEGFLERLAETFTIEETSKKSPASRGEYYIYLDGKWRQLTLRIPYEKQPSAADDLDVSILQRYILHPILGIEDVTTDERISFVGGLRSIDEIERLVDSERARVGFSLYPTTMDDLLTVSDKNEIMPPKSTWFDPKLKDGLLVHLI